MATRRKHKEDRSDEAIIRTYELKNHANGEKVESILDVLFAYRRTASKISNYHWRLFFEEKNGFRDQRDIKWMETKLSKRYMQTCQTQVVGMLKSYISNVQNRFVDKVLNSSIKKEDRVYYFYINKYMLWHRKEVMMQGKPISKEIIFNCKKIFKHLTKHHPKMRHINMVLDEKVATLYKKEENKATSFDFWIKISALKKYQTIWVPLQTNEYFDKIGGIFKHCIQVNYKDGKLSFSVIKELHPEMVEYISKQLSFDVGTVVFLATNHGDHLGKKLMAYIKKYDVILTRLKANLKKQGIKPTDSKRYNKLIKKVKEYVKNEIGRIINKIVKRLMPEEIDVERLDFRGTKLGATNNRIISNFGKGVLAKKLKNITQVKGIRLKEINPPYTSQECPNCHYTKKKNRKTRDRFECGYCGKKGHADSISGKNIPKRSSPEFNNKSKNEILCVLDNMHQAWKDARRYSTAKDMVEHNDLPKGDSLPYIQSESESGQM